AVEAASHTLVAVAVVFFFSSRRRHTRFSRDWSSDVCSSDLCSLSRICSSTFTRRTIEEQMRLMEQSVRALDMKPEELARPGNERSEERRVGKECENRRLRPHQHKRGHTQGHTESMDRTASHT